MKPSDCQRAVRRMNLEEAIDALVDLVGFDPSGSSPKLPSFEGGPRDRAWRHRSGIICSRDRACGGHPSFRAAVRAQVAYQLRELEEGDEL